MKGESMFRRIFISNSYCMDNIKMSSKYRELFDVWVDLENELSERINYDKDLLDLFERYKSAYDSFVVEEVDTFYEAGLKIGMQLGMELVDC